MLYNVFGGGLMLGAIFMATDYATSPVTKPGQLIFGLGCGLLTCFIRRFGSYPEGVCYSILIMNCTTWLLDKYIRPVIYGAAQERKEGGGEVMKISGKFILKVAGTLTVISLVVAALLGLVDNVTADKIAAIDAENTRIAMSAVAPRGQRVWRQAGHHRRHDRGGCPLRAASWWSCIRMTTAGADNGYVMKISASGSQGSIVMMVGVDADKAITGISVVSHAETSGIGTKVVGNEPNAAGEPVLDQFIGDERRGLPGGGQEHHRRLRRYRLHQGHQHGRQCRSGCRRSCWAKKGGAAFMNFGKQLKEGLITQNPVLVQVLGMCSTMAITTSFFNGLGMGVSPCSLS